MLESDQEEENKISIITYGMGVYWSQTAAKNYSKNVEIIDLRTLNPIDDDTIFASVKKNNRCLVVTEEPIFNTFAQSLAGRIQNECFEYLDAPVRVIGSEDLPAIPLNSTLEARMLPSAEKVQKGIEELLNY